MGGQEVPISGTSGGSGFPFDLRLLLGAKGEVYVELEDGR